MDELLTEFSMNVGFVGLDITMNGDWYDGPQIKIHVKNRFASKDYQVYSHYSGNMTLQEVLQQIVDDCNNGYYDPPK